MAGKLDKILKDINKKFDDELAGIGNVPFVRSKVPTPIIQFNWMTYGGLPQAGIVEFSGPEGGGKTSAALATLASHQKHFEELYANKQSDVLLRGAFIDVENTLDFEWAKNFGVNMEEVVYIRPQGQTTEQILDIARTLVNSGEIGWLCIDSVATMVPGSIYDESLEKRNVAGNAMALTRFVNLMAGESKKNNTVIIIINQLRDNVGAGMYEAQTDTPGGRALKHQSILRMGFKRGQYIGKTGRPGESGAYENPQGHLVNMSLIKSKIGKFDRRKGQFTLNYFKGIDVVEDVLQVAMESGVIARAGSYYSLVDITTGEVISDDSGEVVRVQGKEAFKELIRKNDKYMQLILDNISYNNSEGDEEDA